MSVWAVTGHRPPKLGGYADEARELLLRFAVLELENFEPQEVITGMALGWDQAIAEACVELGIPFTAAVPFRGQPRKWPAESQRRYGLLLNAAKCVRVISTVAAASSFQRRNIWMVRNSDSVLALWDGSSGGTANCVRFARSRGRELINCWSDWIEFQEEHG